MVDAWVPPVGVVQVLSRGDALLVGVVQMTSLVAAPPVAYLLVAASPYLASVLRVEYHNGMLVHLEMLPPILLQMEMHLAMLHCALLPATFELFVPCLPAWC